MKFQIHNFLKKEYPDFDFDVSYPPEGFGDYSTNLAFLLSKSRKLDISVVAAEIVEKLKKEFAAEFEKIEVAKNGFINFYLSKGYLRDNISKTLDLPKIGKSKTIIIDYSQPNIAKVMHVGHLRTTVIGDALANIYGSLGYKVVRWNYLGDWGTQFGKLIAAYKMWGGEKEVKESPIETLDALYVRFHEEMKSRPELEEMGRAEFKKLEEGDENNRKLWKWFRDESLKEFEKIYDILGVRFDTYEGESAFEGDLKPLIKDLTDKGVAKESEGAVVVPLEKYGLPPALVQKSDGASLYLTRDIAALKHRIKEYRPEKILYVVGNEQSLHFEQLSAVAEVMGLETEIAHVKFGLILGPDKKKFSSREGRAVPMTELLDKAIELSGKDVGIGALKYFVLKEHRNTDIVFDWNKILDLKGDSGPYLQYTFARLTGIKTKSRNPEIPKFDISIYKNTEISLMKKLIKFPEAVISAARSNLPNILTLYLYELCNLANRFYESSPVLQEEDEAVRSARLGLVDLTARVLERGLALLGMKALERI